MKRPLFFIRVVLLCLMPAFASAHEIHLVNGKVIKSDWVKEENGQVRYENYGGTIAISSSLVQKIVYTDARRRKAVDMSEKRQVVVKNDSKDLESLLNAKLHPRTPVEKANLSTVAIKSDLSFGSGFFISPEGYIITNKHVVRGDKKREDELSAALQKAQGELRQYKQQLDAEYARMAKYRAELQQEWAVFATQQKQAMTDREKQYTKARRSTLENKNNYLRDWEGYFKKRKDKYLTGKDENEKQQQALREQKKKFAALNSFEVILADDTKIYASLYKTSPEHDLAILKVSGYKTPYLQTARPQTVAKGDPVYAIGSPIRMKNSVTSGVLSGIRGNMIQTNAQIYPGNSGGPLINEKGEVLGINTMKMITSKFEGLGFAISIETALDDFKNYLGDNHE